MPQRYVVSAVLDENGSVVQIRAHDNEALESFDVRLDAAPTFIVERIALLRLTTAVTGGPLGFKLNDYCLTVFITHDEFDQLRGECK